MEAKQVPLTELLEAVPADARLVVDDGPYSTRFIPVGKLCHEAAVALRDRLARQSEMDEAIAAGDGTLHGAIDHWQERALKAEASLTRQEPVAWLFTNVQSGDIEASTNPDDKQGEREYWHPAPLYTAPPPAREWQGLTDQEIISIALNHCHFQGEGEYHLGKYTKHAIIHVVRDAIAKLREKNA